MKPNLSIFGDLKKNLIIQHNMYFNSVANIAKFINSSRKNCMFKLNKIKIK